MCTMMVRMAIKWWRRAISRRCRAVTRPRKWVGSLVRDTATAVFRRPRLLIGIL